MSLQLSFAPSFLYQGQMTTQDSIVLVTELSIAAPGTPGKKVELQVTETHLQWRHEGDTTWNDLLALSLLEGEPGGNGTPAEFQVSATHLQWRLVGSATWIDLLPLAVLAGAPGDPGNDGREIQVRVTATHIQWKYDTDVTWTNLIALAALAGAPGDPGEPGAPGDPGSPGDPGPAVELQVTATHIQWRVVGDVSWVQLIALTELKGDPGDDSPPVAPVAGDGISIDDTDPLAPVISATFSGSYTDLTDKPTIPDDPADIGAATAAQGTTADTAVQPGDLATVATTGQYSDLLGKPSIPSTPGDIGAATAAQGAKADTALQPAAIGVSVASLVAGLVPSSQLPSYVDDVLEAANFAALPGTGEAGKIYVLATPYTSGGVTSSQFRWTGSAYAPIIASPGSTDAVTEGSVNLYHTAARVLATVLAGFSTATSTVVTAADSVLAALGKLQAQISKFFVSVPASSGDTGSPGSFAADTNYLYVCTGVNQWKATPLSAWPVAYMSNPMTTAGDLIYGGAAGAPARLGKGTDGQLFMMVSGNPAWATSPYVLTTTYDAAMGDIAAALAAILG